MQFLPVAGALLAAAFDEAGTDSIDKRQTATRALTAEYLALSMQSVGRTKDKRRLVDMFQVTSFDPSTFEQLVATHGLTDKWRRFQTQFLEGGSA